MRTQAKRLHGRSSLGPSPKARCEGMLRKAVAMGDSGNPVGAEEAYRQAVRLYPQGERAWAELGCFLAGQRRFSEACDSFRKTLPLLCPDAALSYSGAIPKDSAREAVRLLEEILAAQPAWLRGQFSAGTLCESIGEFERARAHLGTALALDGSVEGVVRGLFSRMNWREGKLTDAIVEADRAIAAAPRNVMAHASRSVCYSELGHMDRAVAGYRRTIEIIPDPTCHKCVLFGLNFLADTTPETLCAESVRWNSIYAAPLAGHIRPHANVPDPDRRLKLGYVSPDLHNHAIARFLLPVLEHHDGSRFEVFAYSVGAKADGQTDELRRSVAHWVPFQGSGEELAERVRADGIDILVDLAGHTMEWNYFQAFARKPAPVQVSWMGMLSTTGLSTMDYFLGDAFMPCPGTEHLFSEAVYRIPGSFGCYRPPGDLPVAAPPCIERGYVTFGSFHKPAKITREVVRLWSAVLAAVPRSRLLMKYRGAETEAGQRRFAEWFAEDGIGRERLQFAGASPLMEYLAAFGEIDIALDPFPYNGGTTSLDGLWMGVPFVTLTGRLAVQRAGADILNLIGSPGLIAETWEQYVRVAAFLAEAIPKSPESRQNARQTLQSSAIMDEAGVMRRVEAAFRDMWGIWCRTGKGLPRASAPG